MKDLLPKDVPNARIMTFGYSTRLFATQNSNTSKLSQMWKRSRSSSDLKTLQNIPQALYLQSNALLEELAKHRADRASNRPIIFIAHSLGGLIVKGALVQSSASVGERSHYKAIELSTAGALFFGTPHHGSSKAPWDNILTKAASLSLKLPMDQKSDRKAAQAELFDLQVQRYKSVESNFPNYAFLERRATNLKDIKDSVWETRNSLVVNLLTSIRLSLRGFLHQSRMLVGGGRRYSSKSPTTKWSSTQAAGIQIIAKFGIA